MQNKQKPDFVSFKRSRSQRKMQIMSYALAATNVSAYKPRFQENPAASPGRDAADAALPEETNSIAVRFMGTGTVGPEAILTVIGDLDLVNVLEFRDKAFTALGQKPAFLRLDLTSVTYLDTAGLSALLTVVRVAKMTGARACVAPSSRVRRILALSGLADALEA